MQSVNSKDESKYLNTICSKKMVVSIVEALFAEETKFNSQLRTMPQFYPSLSF